MGIPGLLIALKSVTYRVHISEYKGLTVGVDAYCWLHRGAFSCGLELCTGVATDKYVSFCMKRVNLLRQHGVEPIMVFDGASLPLKGEKHLERRRQRDTARSKGEAALAAGEAGAAAQHFSKAVGVTHDMAFALIKELRRSRVELIVAPYEADAQLAFLSRSEVVDVVITEDSDCLPYGCKKVLFKMDNEGHGQEIQLRNLSANSPLTLCNWKNSMFLDLCLLVGCDYMSSSVKGLGISTAHGLVERHRNLNKIIRAVERSKFVVPKGYWEEYKRARVTFRHHIVYDPRTQRTVHLMPLGQTAKDMGNLDFLGSHLAGEVVKGVVSGRLLPTTHKPYEEVDQTEPGASMLLPTRNWSNTTPTRSSYSVGANASAVHFDEEIYRKRMQTASSPSPGGVNACGQTDAWHHSGDPDLRQAMEGPAPATLTGAFIDKPFGTGRPALVELPFPSEEASQGSTVWSALGRESDHVWGLQGNHPIPVSFHAPTPKSPQDSQASQDSQGWEDWTGRSSPSTNRGQERSLLREAEKPSSSDSAHVMQPPCMGTRPVREVDTRKQERGCSSAAVYFSPASRPFPTESLRTNISVDGEATSAASRSLMSPGPSSGEAVTVTWPQLQRWGRANGERWQSLSAVGGDVDVDVGTSVEARKVLMHMHEGQSPGVEDISGGGNQLESTSSWPYGSRTAEVTAPEESDSLHEDMGDGSNFGKAEAISWDEVHVQVQEGLRQGSSALAISETPDVNRAKFVPTSAHLFHTTQVSQGLETLHRRKRRLRQMGNAPPASLLRPRHPHPHQHDLQNQNDRQDQNPNDRHDRTGILDRAQEGSNDRNHYHVRSAESGETWMVQADIGAAQPRHGSGAQLSEPESSDPAENYRGIASFRGGTWRVSPPRPSSAHSTTASLSLSHEENAASPLPCRGPTTHIHSNNSVPNEDRTLTTSSRRWTMPPETGPCLQSTRGGELPLLRLLDGSGDHSWHGRISGARSPSTKRARGTDFWDARLMR